MRCAAPRACINQPSAPLVGHTLFCTSPHVDAVGLRPLLRRLSLAASLWQQVLCTKTGATWEPPAQSTVKLHPRAASQLVSASVVQAVSLPWQRKTQKRPNPNGHAAAPPCRAPPVRPVHRAGQTPICRSLGYTRSSNLLKQKLQLDGRERGAVPASTAREPRPCCGVPWSLAHRELVKDGGHPDRLAERPALRCSIHRPGDAAAGPGAGLHDHVSRRRMEERHCAA